MVVDQCLGQINRCRRFISSSTALNAFIVQISRLSPQSRSLRQVVITDLTPMSNDATVTISLATLLTELAELVL